MALTPLKPTTLDAVHAYARRLAELLVSCAEHQQHDPEVFLWNARRAMEAICHLLLTVKFDQPSVRLTGRDGNLDAMINELRKQGIVDEQQESRFGLLREHTNLGVHIRKPEKEDYPAAVSDVADLLPKAVTWLCEESLAGPFIPNISSLRAAIQEIRRGGRMQAPLTSAARILQEELHELRQRLATLEGDAGRPTPGPRPTPRPTPAPIRAEVTEERAPAPRRWPYALIGGGALVLGLGLGLVVSWLGVRAFHAAEAETAQAAVDPPAPPAPAPPPPPCPTGLALIAASTVRLGQPVPERKKWLPASSAVLPRTEVPAFCVDVAPRTQGAFRAWPGSAALARTPCDWDKGPAAEAQPVVCVDRDSAARYCRDQDPALRLPSIVEWEALIRSEKKGLGRGLDKEWAEDLYPPAVFLRRPARCTAAECTWGMFREVIDEAKQLPADGNALYGWNNQKVGNRWNDLGFRCATEPTDTNTAAAAL